MTPASRMKIPGTQEPEESQLSSSVSVNIDVAKIVASAPVQSNTHTSQYQVQSREKCRLHKIVNWVQHREMAERDIDQSPQQTYSRRWCHDRPTKTGQSVSDVIAYGLYEALPIRIIVGAIFDYRHVNHNSDNERNDVDDNASQHHESRAARACSPCCVRPARFPVAEVHVCDSGESTRKSNTNSTVVRLR